MNTLSNHEIEEIIDTVVFRLNQTRREDILAIPNFIKMRGKPRTSGRGCRAQIISLSKN